MGSKAGKINVVEGDERNINKDKITLYNFLSREYIFRYIWKHDKQAARYKECIDILSDELQEINFSDYIVKDKKILSNIDKIDLLLDFYFTTKSADAPYTFSIETMEDRIQEKTGAQKKFYDLASDLTTNFEQRDDWKAFNALDILFKASLKYGVYASHLKSFYDTDYPASNEFDICFLEGIVQPIYPSLDFDSNYITFLSSSEFGIKYDDEKHDIFLYYLYSCYYKDALESECDKLSGYDCVDYDKEDKYTFRVRLNYDSYTHVVDEFKKLLLKHVINHKLANNIYIYNDEYAAFVKLFAKTDKNAIRIDSKESRICGLKIWDKVNIYNMSFDDGIELLCKENAIFKIIEKCPSDAVDCGNICQYSPQVTCAEKLRSLLKYTDECIEKRKILSTEEAKKTGKIKK
jgi:hypothetical protein